MRTEGLPMIICSLRGKGNIAAPAIDTEKDRINIAGMALDPSALQAPQSPMTKNRLKIEQAINPVENTYRELVPKAPDSPTILET